MILWTPKGLSSIMSPILSFKVIHTACILGSDWFHTTAAGLGGPPTVLASPTCWNPSATGLHLHQQSFQTLSLPRGVKPYSMTPSILGFLLQLRLHLLQWPFQASQGIKPRHLLTTPSRLQASRSWEPLTHYQVHLPLCGTALAPWTTASVY